MKPQVALLSNLNLGGLFVLFLALLCLHDNLVGVHGSLVEHIKPLDLFESVDLGPYHSSQEIVDELSSLSLTCPGMELGKKDSGNISMAWVKLNPVVGHNNPSSSMRFQGLKASTTTRLQKGGYGGQGEGAKILMFFGEHARELISPELALSLIRLLCAQEKDLRSLPSDPLWSQVAELRESSSFLIFPNINQAARERVEGGQYCLRTNLRKVDLNRNWDDHWQKSKITDGETSGGPSAFSESETQILRDAATEFRPTQFYTIHSGSLSMLSPYAYEPKIPVHTELVERILENLAPKFCECPYGNAAKALGYVCPGTCLDYIYDQLDVKFSYAFEIYAPGRSLPQAYLDLSTSLLNDQQSEEEGVRKKRRTSAPNFFTDFSQSIVSKKTSLVPPHQGTREWYCFADFNPPHRDSYLATIENWSRACVAAFSSIIHLHNETI